MVTTYTLNETGQRQVVEFVVNFGNDRVADNIQHSEQAKAYWFEKAEQSKQNGHSSMEMRMTDTRSRNPELCDLSDDMFDVEHILGSVLLDTTPARRADITLVDGRLLLDGNDITQQEGGYESAEQAVADLQLMYAGDVWALDLND